MAFRVQIHLRAVLALILLLGCCIFPGKGNAADKEISIFTMQLKPMYTDYMESVFKAFEAKHPGVKVKWLDFPAQNYETKLLSLVVSNQAPDVMNLPFEYMLSLRERGLLLELDDKLTSDQKGLYVDAVIKNGCSIAGKLYAVPWYLSTSVLMYNKELLKKAGLDPSNPPKSNSGIIVAARQIKEKTGTFGFLMNFTEDGQIKSMFASEGIPLVDSAKKKALFNTPEAVALLKTYKELFDTGVIPRESMTAEHRRAIDLFKQQKTAFLVSGAQFLLQVEADSKDVYANTAAATAPPIGKTGDFAVDTQNLAIYSKTANPKEAVELALWVTNAENQLAFSKMVTIFPSVKSALADSYFSKPGESARDQARNVGAKQLEKAAVLLPELPRISELNKVMNEVARRIFLKNEDIKAVLDDAEKKWNEILNK
ncbi:MAG: sugar ABC transporter substrate-binding protein [Candidatus Sumerlaeaceae bacterium]|nr:sugar ABC transporter substrate-binding protein [Candidatus Sumerlaeaceae bacterium]